LLRDSWGLCSLDSETSIFCCRSECRLNFFMVYQCTPVTLRLLLLELVGFQPSAEGTTTSATVRSAPQRERTSSSGGQQPRSLLSELLQAALSAERQAGADGWAHPNVQGGAESGWDMEDSHSDEEDDDEQDSEMDEESDLEFYASWSPAHRSEAVPIPAPQK